MRKIKAVVGEVSALQNTTCCWSATTTRRLYNFVTVKTMMVADTRKGIKLDEDIATHFLS
jgi:hypothetical protein